MFAADFLFDNQRASDFGCMICSFDGGVETASGGEIEYNVVKTPARDNFTFYGSQFNSVITWNFSICKNPCKNDNMYFDQYEESMIAKWLLKTDGYRWIQFDQEGYEDIFYNVCISMMPHQVAGRTVGFDLVATSDCAYGFSDVITKKVTLQNGDILNINVHNDVNSYIYPYIKINGTGYFHIIHYRVIHQLFETIDDLEFKNISHEIIMDSANDFISGLNSPNDFNWHFLRLIDGNNYIQTTSNNPVTIEIQYREIRFVRV